MTDTITDAVSARSAIQLTPGRHALVASQIRARLDSAELADFGDLLAELETEATNAVGLSRSRRGVQGAYGEESRAADEALDAALATVDALVAAYERAHGAETAVGKSARFLRKRLFPRGLAGIAQASFPDELAQVLSLLADVATPEVHEHLGRIPGLTEAVSELAPRAARLRTALDREQQGGASHRDVLAATTRTEARLAELVSGIVYRYRGDDLAKVSRRQFLLEPYTIQVQALRDRFRRRAPVSDVDPETGVELDAAKSVEA